MILLLHQTILYVLDVMFLERTQKLIVSIDCKIRDEKYNMILTEKQQKYHHYQQAKLINMNILQAKKHYILLKVKYDRAS